MDQIRVIARFPDKVFGQPSTELVQATAGLSISVMPSHLQGK